MSRSIDKGITIWDDYASAPGLRSSAFLTIDFSLSCGSKFSSMAETKTTTATKTTVTTPTPSFFSKDNYLWMLAGLVVIVIGMFLMAGGASKDPNVFNKEEVYSAQRITIAPILIIVGLVIEIYAIFRKPKG